MKMKDIMKAEKKKITYIEIYSIDIIQTDTTVPQ